MCSIFLIVIAKLTYNCIDIKAREMGYKSVAHLLMDELQRTNCVKMRMFFVQDQEVLARIEKTRAIEE